MTRTLETEVAIVGAGAAGALFAARLARAGRRVIVLESGPAWTTNDLQSSQLWARRLKWGGVTAISHPPGSLSHNLSHGRGLGGAALHHYATWPRFSPEAFELRSRFGSSLDWPFSYDTLRPYYDRIQEEMGIAGDAAQERDRPPAAPYPMPPLMAFKQGEMLRAGFETLGMAVSPLPAAINSVERNGRPACIYDGWCDAGCPIGALANPLVTHIPAAQRSGAEFLTETTAVEIVADQTGARAVRAIDPDGDVLMVSARLVILAASVIQNPRLLLNSRSALHPDGLANASGLVGAYLTIESGAGAYGVMAEETDNFMGVNAGQFMYRGAHRARGKPDGGYQWQIAPAMKPNDIFGVAFTRPGLFGASLDQFLRNDAKRLAALVGFGAETSQRENRVTVSAQARDRFGAPLAETHYARSPQSHALWEHMNEEGRRVLAAAGATQAWNGPLVPGHLSGGTIMGNDPAASVTDSYGRAHGVGNLVIAGAGLFPATDGASPTFTLYALAERSAEHILAHWNDYAL